MYDLRQVSCGAFHMAAVTASGQLFTWGDGFGGKLGHGDSKACALPQRVEALSGLQVLQTSFESKNIRQLSIQNDVATTPHASAVRGRGSSKSRRAAAQPATASPRPGVWTGTDCGALQVLGVACGTWHTAAIAREPERGGAAGDVGHVTLVQIPVAGTGQCLQAQRIGELCYLLQRRLLRAASCRMPAALSKDRIQAVSVSVCDASVQLAPQTPAIAPAALALSLAELQMTAAARQGTLDPPEMWLTPCATGIPAAHCGALYTWGGSFIGKRDTHRGALGTGDELGRLLPARCACALHVPTSRVHGGALPARATGAALPAGAPCESAVPGRKALQPCSASQPAFVWVRSHMACIPQHWPPQSCTPQHAGFTASMLERVGSTLHPVAQHEDDNAVSSHVHPKMQGGRQSGGAASAPGGGRRCVHCGADCRRPRLPDGRHRRSKWQGQVGGRPCPRAGAPDTLCRAFQSVMPKLAL